MAGQRLELLPGCALHRVDAGDAEELLRVLAGVVVDHGYAHPSLPAAVVERERRFPTGLPTPIPSAIPHTDPEHLLRSGVAVASLARPLRFAQMGGTGESLDVRLVVLLCVTDPAAQVEALQQVLGRLADSAALERLLADDDPLTFAAAVADWLG